MVKIKIKKKRFLNCPRCKGKKTMRYSDFINGYKCNTCDHILKEELKTKKEESYGKGS